MKAFRTLAAGLAGLIFATTAQAGGGALHAHGPDGGWPFDGPLGKFDQASLQRGYQVYKEICSSCHSMKLLSYRNLGEKGGPFYDPAYPNANDNPFVKALAAENEILSPTPNDVGDYDYRPAMPADRFRSPYANDNAARAANGGANPPDLSVITKARHAGASYIYSLLTGYPEDAAFSTHGDETHIDVSKVGALSHGDDAEHGADTGHSAYIIQPAGQYYNPYMAGDTTPQFVGDPRHAPAGGFLAMAPQLIEGRITYTDGTDATPDQMAHDVAQFLTWAGEPKQANRKNLGLATMLYLVILTILLWFSYKAIWRNVEH